MKMTIPTGSRLTRGRENWNIWMRLCRDILQASGDWGAITEDYSNFEIEEDSDSDDEELALDVSDSAQKHGITPMKQESFGKQLFQQTTKQKNKQILINKKIEKQDARARTIIRNSIDMQTFEYSTSKCATARQLWEKLMPTEQLTDSEIQRMIAADLSLETYSENEFGLVDKMYEIVNKAELIHSDNKDKSTMYEVQAIKAVMLSLEGDRLRFFEVIAAMNALHTPQTVSEFEIHFSKLLKREKEVKQHNQRRNKPRTAAYNASSSQDHDERHCTYCSKNGHTSDYCFQRQRDEGKGGGKGKGKGKGKGSKGKGKGKGKGGKGAKGNRNNPTANTCYGAVSFAAHTEHMSLLTHTPAVRQVRTRPYHHRPKQRAWEAKQEVLVDESLFKEEVEAVVDKIADEIKGDLDSDSDNPALISSSDNEEDGSEADGRRERLSKLHERVHEHMPHTTPRPNSEYVVGVHDQCVEHDDTDSDNQA